MAAFYNEIDPVAAQWLRNLIAAGHIAPGVVDERSIEDIIPEELYAYTQCHFFAGVGVWSLALRLAAWPDDRPIWTGSCPCQPFSAAGKGDGFADERHLWPAFYQLIAECRPAALLGEQVASSAVDAWIDLVHADLEALGYAFGSVPFPSAGVGAPHIRDRNYWVAHAEGDGHKRAGKLGQPTGWHGVAYGSLGGMGDTQRARLEGRSSTVGSEQWTDGQIIPRGAVGGLADTGDSAGQRSESRPIERGLSAGIEENAAVRPGPINGFWRDADWIGCRDGKWRPVEPGTFPLAHGAAARVGRLRAYGNAINAQAARIFIETVMECL